MDLDFCKQSSGEEMACLGFTSHRTLELTKTILVGCWWCFSNEQVLRIWYITVDILSSGDHVLPLRSTLINMQKSYPILHCPYPWIWQNLIGRPLQNSSCEVKTQVEIPHLFDAVSWITTPMSTLLYCKLKEFTSGAKRNQEVYRRKKKKRGGELILNSPIWNIVTCYIMKVEHSKTKPLEPIDRRASILFPIVTSL